MQHLEICKLEYLRAKQKFFKASDTLILCDITFTDFNRNRILRLIRIYYSNNIILIRFYLIFSSSSGNRSRGIRVRAFPAKTHLNRLTNLANFQARSTV